MKCNICDKEIKGKNLSRHKREVHGEDKKDVFDCHFCDRKLTSQTYFDKHLKTHFNQIEYKCPTCYRIFRQKGHYTFHLKNATHARCVSRIAPPHLPPQHSHEYEDLVLPANTHKTELIPSILKCIIQDDRQDITEGNQPNYKEMYLKLLIENADLKSKLENLEEERKNDLEIVSAVNHFLTPNQLNKLTGINKKINKTEDEICNAISLETIHTKRKNFISSC